MEVLARWAGYLAIAGGALVLLFGIGWILVGYAGTRPSARSA